MTSYGRLRDATTGDVRKDCIRRGEDGAFIPSDPDNVDWQAYQAWLAAGNVPQGAEPAPVPGDASHDA